MWMVAGWQVYFSMLEIVANCWGQPVYMVSNVSSSDQTGTCAPCVWSKSSFVHLSCQPDLLVDWHSGGRNSSSTWTACASCTLHPSMLSDMSLGFCLFDCNMCICWFFCSWSMCTGIRSNHHQSNMARLDKLEQCRSIAELAAPARGAAPSFASGFDRKWARSVSMNVLHWIWSTHAGAPKLWTWCYRPTKSNSKCARRAAICSRWSQ